MFPEIDAVQLETLPFEHFIGNGEIHANRMAWLDWLEQKAPWRLTAEEFYEQYEFSLIHTLLPPVVQQLVCQNTPLVTETSDVHPFSSTDGRACRCDSPQTCIGPDHSHP